MRPSTHCTRRCYNPKARCFSSSAPSRDPRRPTPEWIQKAKEAYPQQKREHDLAKPHAGSGAAPFRRLYIQPQRGHLVKDEQAHKQRSERTLSLLSELFPAEMQNSKAVSSGADAAPMSAPREIPVQPLDLEYSRRGRSMDEDRSVDQQERDQQERDEILQPPMFDVKRKRNVGDQKTVLSRRDDLGISYDETTVLMLHSAGRNLVKEDFLRAMPRARHIQGWSQDAAAFRVIKIRDKQTLEAQGHYLLLFQTAEAARAYKDNVERLHTVGKNWLPNPKGTDNRIPPPPIPSGIRERLESGEKRPSQGKRPSNEWEYRGQVWTDYDDLAGFTLVPPSQNSHGMRRVRQPVAPILREIIDHGSYEVLKRNSVSDWEVMLRPDTFEPGAKAIREAVVADGEMRRLPWDVVDESNWVREVEVSHIKDDVDPANMPPPEKDDADVDTSVKEEVAVRKALLTIVSFRTRDEAQRFVAAWHRRDLSPLLLLQPTWPRAKDTPVRVSAEIIE